jgi:tetratricopeptide (TPR) repeat protein
LRSAGGRIVKEVRVLSVWAFSRRTGWHAAFRVLRLGLALLAAGALAAPLPAAAANLVRGEVAVSTENGFARLVFTFADDVEAEAKLNNSIILITFKRPVDVMVDKLDVSSGGYIGAARRDPDGKGIRIALARKVTMNAMSVAEKLFVDLLPDNWSGLPPGLPREVIEELARRAREAEKKARQQRALAEQTQMPAIKLRVARQPTFARYVFDLPQLIGVSANSAKDKLTLTFDTLLKFDLADARATLPAFVSAIETGVEQENAFVRFNFAGKVDIRSFREGMSYVVDVTPMEGRSEGGEDTVRPNDLPAVVAAELAARAKLAPAVEPPQTVPARAPVATPTAAPIERMREAQPVHEAQPPPPPPAETTPPPPAATPPTAPSNAPDKETLKEAPPRAAAVEPPPAPPPPPVAEPNAEPVARVVQVALKRQGENLRLQFPFTSATPAAIFARGDTLWLVFDTDATLAVGKLQSETGGAIRGASTVRRDDIAIVRIKLDRPRLVSAMADGPTWTVAIGEVLEPTRAATISRSIVGSTRASISIAFDEAYKLHQLRDPEAGDTLLVATAFGPARGLIKAQDFLELRALISTHGIVLQPIADDLTAELAADKIVISRPSGLILSPAIDAGGRSGSGAYQRHVLNPQSWEKDRHAEFRERNERLIRAAAEAPEARRPSARADLARFYLARDMGVEAKAVLDVALAETPPTAEDPTPVVLHAVANIQIGRLDSALKDLAHPFVGNQYDAPMWRAVVYSRQGKWNEAREGFRTAAMTLGTLPLELQRSVLKDSVRASLESGDITGAVTQMQEFEAIGVSRELEPSLAVLSGRIAEGLGRIQDALRAYSIAADSWDRPAAAQARLRELALRNKIGHLKRADAIDQLETLTTSWRGDETEIEALALLARLYTQEGRSRDAFHVMRTALTAHPEAELSQHIRDEAAASFESIFLAGKGDGLAPIDALALFYDFRDLTPIGRRGDEMIRRLADRLVSVDLLDQAAELLQHQVDHRLQGAARAQVAVRLAVVYLMNRKADRALAALRTTRSPDLAGELRTQRLLLEARALSDAGRHAVALEVIADLPGAETARLRADILWAAKRWRAAAEQIEANYGDRWREFAPLADGERQDMLRAAVGYVLGDDAIGLARFRERYASKMEEGPDRRAFDVISEPAGPGASDARDGEFRELAHTIASVDTLAAFLRDLGERHPNGGVVSAPLPQATPTSIAPQAAPANAKPEPPTGTATPHRAADPAASPLPPNPLTAPRPAKSRTAAR